MDQIAIDFKTEMLSHKNQTWILVTPEPKDLKFSPLIETIDWFNGQLLTKSFKKEKLTLAMGEKTLFCVSPLLPASRIISVGLGKSRSTSIKMDAGEICDLIRDTIKDLSEEASNSESIWIALSEDCPKSLLEDLKPKLKSRFKNVTVG